jgi:hypothetical protein
MPVHIHTRACSHVDGTTGPRGVSYKKKARKKKEGCVGRRKSLPTQSLQLHLRMDSRMHYTHTRRTRHEERWHPYLSSEGIGDWVQGFRRRFPLSRNQVLNYRRIPFSNHIRIDRGCPKHFRCVRGTRKMVEEKKKQGTPPLRNPCKMSTSTLLTAPWKRCPLRE